MLKIVQQQQLRSASRASQARLEHFHRRLRPSLPDSQRLDDHRSQQSRIAQRRQRHKIRSSGEVFGQTTRQLYRQTRLANSSRTRDRDQRHVRPQQKLFRCSHFFFPPKKPVRWTGRLEEAVSTTGSAAFSEKPEWIALSPDVVFRLDTLFLVSTTGAMNRYPRPVIVCTKRGCSGSSFRTWRILRIAALMLLSVSRKRPCPKSAR